MEYMSRRGAAKKGGLRRGPGTSLHLDARGHNKFRRCGRGAGADNNRRRTLPRTAPLKGLIDMKLLCVDGNSVLNRAFYGIKLLTTKDGRYTNAVFGFMNILIKLEEALGPDAVAVAFDLPAPTFRHKMYDAYKGTRKGMPEELASQMQPLKDLLGFLGYRIVTCEGYEADDILGTFAASCRERGDDCFIATGDRDSLQLVGGTVRVMLTTTKFGRGETELLDETAVKERYGVTPRQLIDVKALMGDASDNIPGVAGVGEKTALALISRFGSLDGVYGSLESPDIKKGVHDKLVRDRDTAYLSYRLAEINCRAPIDCEPAGYVRSKGDPAAASALLGELEMHSLVTRLGLPQASAAASTAGEKAPETPAPEIEVEAASPGCFEGAKCVWLLPLEDAFYATDGVRAYKLDKTSLRALLGGETPVLCCDSKRVFHAAGDLGVPARCVAFDLTLAAYLLSPSSSDYSPETLASEYGVKPDFVCGAHGLGLLKPLCERLRARLEAEGMAALHDDIELPLSRVLCDMERCGFFLDTEGVRGFGRELSGIIDAEQQSIFALAGREFNINSPRQLGSVLFEDLGLPAGKKTKSGYSTNAETLEGLAGKHPIIEHILRYRTYQKLSSTYVEGLLAAADADGIIHTEFVQTETRTGRISSREPNLQNIPVRTELGSRFRKYFKARAGRVLLDADYSQIELRVLASVSGDEGMIRAFKEGHDIHTETASEIFKTPRDKVTPELRRRAKAVNFGIVYGIGAFSLAKDTGVSFSEAKDYIDGYLASYPDVAAYLETTVKNAERDGYVTTAFGRRRALPELASSNKTVKALGRRLAMNTPIQGTAADIIKIAMIRVSEKLAEKKLDARLVLQVHDELIVESALDCAGEAAEILKREMESACELRAGLVAEVGQGATWYDAK